MQSHSAPPGLCPPTTGARGAAAPAHARPPTARWSSRARWLYGCKDPASRSGGSRELDKPALRAICEDTRNAVRARVRLCPTACPTALQFPMVKPNQAGIIIRVSGVRVPPPASRKARNPGAWRLPRQLRLRRHRGAPRRLRRADDRGGRSTRRRPALPRRGGPPLARHATTPRWPSQSHAPRRREPRARRRRHLPALHDIADQPQRP